MTPAIFARFRFIATYPKYAPAMLPRVPGRAIPSVKPTVMRSLRLSPPPPLLLEVADDDGGFNESPVVELDCEAVFVEAEIGLLRMF